MQKGQGQEIPEGRNPPGADAPAGWSVVVRCRSGQSSQAGLSEKPAQAVPTGGAQSGRLMAAPRAGRQGRGSSGQRPSQHLRQKVWSPGLARSEVAAPAPVRPSPAIIAAAAGWRKGNPGPPAGHYSSNSQ
jgi:hypothetical protein